MALQVRAGAASKKGSDGDAAMWDGTMRLSRLGNLLKLTDLSRRLAITWKSRGLQPARCSGGCAGTQRDRQAAQAEACGSSIVTPGGLTNLLTARRVCIYAVALLLATAALYLVSAARSKHLIEPNGQIIGRDYLAFYMAGDMLRRGPSSRLYDPLAQQAYQRQFMQEINPSWTGTCLYLNPPHFAGAMSLIAPLGYGASLTVWWLLSLGCFAGTVLVWRRWLRPGPVGLAVILVVCMPAWFQALAGGQNSFITLLILTLFCELLMAGRSWWAGLVLSLLAYKFQFLAVPAGWLVLTRRWRTVGGLCLGGVLTLGATIALLGPGVVIDYARFAARLGELMQYEGFDAHKQCSWYGFFHLLGEGWMPTAAIRLLAVTACLITLVLMIAVQRGPWPNPPARLPIQLAALLLATLMMSPHLFHYDMLIAALPAMLWLRAARENDVAGTTAAVKAVLALGFVALAVSAPLAGLLRVQLLPAVMMAWLGIYVRVSRRPESRCAAITADRAALRVATQQPT